MQQQIAEEYDLCLSTDWEYDSDFLALVEKYAREKGLSTYIVHEELLQESIVRINNESLKFRLLFDRASDSEPAFIKLNDLFVNKNIPVFESLEQMKWASDKATMHLEFIENGINTPHTIILPAFRKIENLNISVHDLAVLGRPFIIKPANTTGGGIGVVEGAESLEDILKARIKFRSDKYLLQEKIKPVAKEGKRFWFRGYYSCGFKQFSWWNDLTHESEILTPAEIDEYNLNFLNDLLERIKQICQLNFFSTELAITNNGKYIVVDYVNEACDMRLKSKHYDGVPDQIVHNIAKSISDHINKILQ